MKTLKTILLYGVIALFISCEPEEEPGELITLEVFGATVSCTSNNKGSCYIVRAQNSEEPFNILAEDIEGFQFEPRFRYLISVRKTLLPKEVPSQPNRYSYKLVDILSKEVEEGLDLEGVWKATLFTNPDKPENWEKYQMTINIIMLYKWIIGPLGCNSTGIIIEKVKGNQIAFGGGLPTTMRGCFDRNEENFHRFAWFEIRRSKTYKVTGTKLELFDEIGALLVEFEKVQP
jgi:hypothetical protein